MDCKVNEWIKLEQLNLLRSVINKNLFNWLAYTKNITEAIKKTGANLSLQVLNQSFGISSLDEKKILGIGCKAKTYIREVAINANKDLVVNGRVVIPEETYFNYKDVIDNLGDSGIGNAFLYNDKNIIRLEFEFKKINSIWARRSIFLLPKGSLLVCEFFTNAIQKLSLIDL